MEVSFVKEELKFCDIKLQIFNNTNSALEKIEEDSINDIEYDNTIYLINKKEIHWVYIGEKK